MAKAAKKYNVTAETLARNAEIQRQMAKLQEQLVPTGAIRGSQVFREAFHPAIVAEIRAEAALAKARATRKGLAHSVTFNLLVESGMVNEDGTPTAAFAGKEYADVVAYAANKRRTEAAEGADSTVVEAVAAPLEA